jgi:hypothetical protein
MPLSLVLHATFTTWHREMRRLNDWNQLVDLEEQLLERARGAFMARWFGTALPLYMGDLRIVIANIDELRTRYQELRRQAGGGTNASELNLTEPLAGITGMLAGSLLSPTSSMVLMSVIDEQMSKWYVTLAAALNALTFGALGTLVAGVAGPAVILGVPYWALTKPDQAHAAHDFLGVLAGLFVSARKFIEQIVGPRDAVHNPLLGKLLDLLGGLATLLPFVLAFVAFVFTWVGPKLAPLAAQIDVMIDLVQSVFVAVGDVVDDLLGELGGLFSGRHSLTAVLHGVMGTLTDWWAATRKQFGGLADAGAKPFDKVAATKPPGFKGQPQTELRLLHDINTAFGNPKLKDFIETMTSGSWLVLQAKEAGSRLQRFGAIFGNLDKHPVVTPKPGFFKRQLNSVTGWAKDRQIGKAKSAMPHWPDNVAFPDSPTIAAFPSFDDYLTETKLKAPRPFADSNILVDAFRKPGSDGLVFMLGSDAQEALGKLQRSPPDVFAGERKALLAGQTATKFLDEARATEAKLRTMLFAAIDTLLPAAAGAEVPKLQGMLWELDDALYGRKAEFPVRDLPVNEAVDVKIDRVRVIAPGHGRETVRAWGKDLRTALQGQRYGTTVAAAS